MDSNSVAASRYNYEPLRIRAWLLSAVIADEWLPLDGVLFYQSVRNDLGRQDITIPGRSTLAQPKGEPMQGTKMPLKVVHGKEWYYRCSWAQWGPYVDGQDHWNKRFDAGLSDLIDFGGKRGRVIIEQSTYKAYHMPIYYRSALWVEWYCMADRERVEYLLSTVTNLGKKSSQGWGWVSRWEIKPAAEDWSIWRDGRLMRGIPPQDLPAGGYPVDLSFANYGLRPSYWDRRNQIMLVMPQKQ